MWKQARYVVCDECGAASPSASSYEAAGVLAAEYGWMEQGNDYHLCPLCVKAREFGKHGAHDRKRRVAAS
jgi:hypothetical protein